MYRKFLFYFLIISFITACKQSSSGDDLAFKNVKQANNNEIEALILQFIEAEDNQIIIIPEGYFELNTQLILDKKNQITIKGAGKEKSILSFKNLSTGGEGLKISGDNIVLEHFTVIDSPGDCIKAQHCNGISFKNVKTTWTNKDLSKSGTYGIYPVQCKNVLVENCEVSFSRDAGIYVGQSENIIVRNNFVHENVAGIEIENSDNAEVYLNISENNTGGILVFNLPGLPKAWGSNTKIFDNTIRENNHRNFATSNPNENGNPVSMIPPGSGVVIFAGDSVEIFNNKLINQKTVSIAIASYQITGLPLPETPGWSPYSKNIYVHDNFYQREMGIPDVTKDLGKLIAVKCFKSQDVLYDGIVENQNPSENPMNICIRENTNDFRFSRLEIPENGDFANISVQNDDLNFNCKIDIKTNLASFKKK